MADDNATPMSDGGIDTPPTNTEFQPAEPLKNAGIEFDAGRGPTKSGGTDQTGTSSQQGGRIADGVQALKSNAGSFGQQATDKARQFVEDGKTKATDALQQLSQMLTDAAGQVDEKLGAQYGDYARNAAGSVQGFADTVRNKDVDAMIEDARAFVSRSPGVAVGVAAALGFAVARVVQSGLDAGSNRA